MKEKRLYLDENHNFVKPEDARLLLIHEYDDSGRMIRETWVDLKPK